MLEDDDPHREPPADEASYTCPTCGETIVIPLDVSAGEVQEYVEDCPVCCRPNRIHVVLGNPPDARAESE